MTEIEGRLSPSHGNTSRRNRGKRIPYMTGNNATAQTPMRTQLKISNPCMNSSQFCLIPTNTDPAREETAARMVNELVPVPHYV